MFAVAFMLAAVAAPPEAAPLPGPPIGSIADLFRPGDLVAISSQRDPNGARYLEIVAADEVTDRPGTGLMLNRPSGASASVVVVIAVSEAFLTHTSSGLSKNVVHLPAARIAAVTESVDRYRARSDPPAADAD